MDFKIPAIPKFTRRDWAALIVLIVVVAILAIPQYADKGGCEVARPEYKCESAKLVITENCQLWEKYSCDTTKDNSLPQVEWYIGKLCDIHNRLHGDDKLDCSNLKSTCDSLTGLNKCSVG